MRSEWIDPGGRRPECYREGVQRLRGCRRRRDGNDGRVDPTAQEDADGHVATHLTDDGSAERRTDSLLGPSGIAWVAIHRRCRVRTPELRELEVARRVDRQPTARLKLANVLDEAVRGGDESK